MQELTTQWAGFATGLRPSSWLPAGAEFLADCMNLVPTADGALVAVERPRYPYAGETGVAWPLPQIILTNKYEFLLTTKRLKISNDSTNLDSVVSIDSKSQAHVADFTDYVVFATEEACFSFIDGVVKEYENRKFKTCIDFYGQLVMGNGSFTYGEEVISGDNLVYWTLINSDDIVLEPNQESGYSIMPWDGEVYKIMPLGDNLIVYGDKGIARLTPTTSPVPTFGVTKIADYGLVSRDAVTGNDQIHFFINNEGKLCTLVPERALSSDGKSPVVVGYKEYLGKSKRWWSSWDSLKNDAWFTDGRISYIANANGLGKSSFVSPNTVRRGHRLIGVHYPYEHPVGCWCISHDLDFNSSDFKTISFVEYFANGFKKFLAGGFLKNTTKNVWSGPYFRLGNWNGTVYQNIRAKHHRLFFHTFYSKSVSINYCNIKVKFDGKRFIRGVGNANSSNDAADS